MANKPARESGYDGEESRKADAEVAANPDQIVWERVRGGIWVQRLIKYAPPKPRGRRPRPECKCNLFGSPRRRTGPHHEDSCARSKPW